jgi:DNA-binding XRE family transcriptional regulator
MQKKRAPDTIPNKLLREQRELKGWTQEDLAEKIGAAPKSVSRWESGMLPSLYHRRKLCEVFGKSPHELGFTRAEAEDGKEHHALGPMPGQSIAASVPRKLSPHLAGSLGVGSTVLSNQTRYVRHSRCSHPILSPSDRPIMLTPDRRSQKPGCVHRG